MSKSKNTKSDCVLLKVVTIKIIKFDNSLFVPKKYNQFKKIELNQQANARTMLILEGVLVKRIAPQSSCAFFTTKKPNS